MPFIKICYNCPLCGTQPDCVCDNSCGTYICESCDIEFYGDINTNQIVIGHSGNCGIYIDNVE